MTMVHERTRSVVQTERFLQDLVQDASLPETMRLRAKGLLRHYPASSDIWLAGKLEELRKAELYLLEETHGPLPPVLGFWLVTESLFSDDGPDSDSRI
jgi:hypothetical protein